MVLCALVVAVASLATPEPAHTLAFWKGVVRNQFAVPANADISALANELAAMLASPDPEVRDDIAYATLAAWIYQKRVIGPEQLEFIADRLLANLKDGVGEQNTDGVFRRSFSALTLSVIVARDNATPFLAAQAFRRTLDAALTYLDAERDLRGYDPVHGWMHSAAHTADLVKFLARSRYLDPVDQPRVLDAIARKLANAPIVFTHGEDERFARAVLSIVNRSDFDRAAFDAWVVRSKPRAPSARPTPQELSGGQNVKNLLAKLEVLLSDPQAPDNVRTARDAVRLALKDLF